MRRFPVIIILATVLLIVELPRGASFVRTQCGGRQSGHHDHRDVTTLISDSGYARYRITTDLWQMFEDAAEPFWRFPYGLFLQQYDQQMKPSSSVVCDSATYYSRQRLWQLDGHGDGKTLRDTFLTQRLFWDQTRQKSAPTRSSRLVRSDRIIEGYGFVSNQNMTAYNVNPNG